MDFQIINYGQNRELNCTDQEQEIYDAIRSMLDDNNLESNVLRLVRKSSSYVSICMESSGDYGLMDLARIKYTSRARWIKICPDFEKIALHDLEDITQYVDELCAAYHFNEPYL